MTPSDRPHDGTDDRPRSPAEPTQTGADGPGGSLLQGATAALLGMAGLGALSGTASASGSIQHLLVFGDGQQKHSYEIEMRSGGSISKAGQAGSNDTRHQSYYGDRIEGEIWQWNVDSYTYTGEIEAVTLDGSLSVQIPDGAFRSATTLNVDGQSNGTHRFEIDSQSADIKPVAGTTESTDTDEGGSWSERADTNDRIAGQVAHTYHDSYSLGSGDPIQHLAVSDGNVRFSR